MKQILAIVMLVAHAFNMGGYRLIFNHLEQSAEIKMASVLETSGYNDSDLVEVKIPVRLPYQTSQSQYERFEGEIVFNGVHYNYVKRKIVNDTLIVLCLPNTEKTGISTARETFFSLVNDLNNSTEESSLPAPVKTAKFSKTEYTSQSDFVLQVPEMILESFSAEAPENYPASSYIETVLQPPELMA